MIFRKSVEKFQFSLKSDKNKGYFTWRPTYILIISRSFLLRMRNVSDKSCRENQNTQFVFSNFFFFRKLCRLWENLEKSWRAGQVRWQYGACALQAGYLKLQIHTLRLCNTRCFSIAMVARTRLNVTLYVHSLSCCVLYPSQNKWRLILQLRINWLAFITETESVYCAVRTEPPNITQLTMRIKPRSVYEDTSMWIYYIISAVKQLHVSVRFCDHVRCVSFVLRSFKHTVSTIPVYEVYRWK